MSPGHARCALSLLAPSLIISVPLGLAPAGAADQKLETPVPITDEGRVFSKPLDRPVRVEERSEDSQEESASEDESRDQQRPKSGLEAPELPVEEYERQMKEMRRRVPAHTPEWTDHQESDSGAAAAPPKTRVPAPKTQVPAPKRRALERRLHPRDGSVRFGDGEHGRTPETGGVDAPTYRPGGGAAGAVQDRGLVAPGDGGFAPEAQVPRALRRVPLPSVIRTDTLRMEGFGRELPTPASAAPVDIATNTLRMTGYGTELPVIAEVAPLDIETDTIRMTGRGE